MNGQVITFYSYKGGTGRTMALANVATLLSEKDKVLVVDWDLEAPGLHYFFKNEDIDNATERPGLIDLFQEIQTLLEQHSDWKSDQYGNDLFGSINFGKYLYTIEDKLQLLAAGKLNEDYPRQVAAFQWEALFYRAPWLFRSFAHFLTSQYDFVLVDSRTGLNDISGICTALMPDKLIAIFTPSRQSIEGIIGAIKSAFHYRKESDDLRPLNIFPLPSRIELQEKDLLDEWRFGVKGYQPLFERLLKELYDLKKYDLNYYFDKIQIQQFTYYAYGERIAVSETQATGRLSLGESYLILTKAITTHIAPWTVQNLQSNLQNEIEKPLDEEETSAESASKVQDLLVDAEAAYRAAEYDRAIELFRQVLEFEPKNEQAKDHLAKSEINKLAGDAATGLPRTAVQYYRRARSYIALGDMMTARNLLNAAIEAAQAKEIKYFEAEEALSNVQKLLTIDDLKQKAKLAMETAQWNDVLDLYHEVLRLDSTNDLIRRELESLQGLLRADYVLRSRSVLEIFALLGQLQDTVDAAKTTMNPDNSLLNLVEKRLYHIKWIRGCIMIILLISVVLALYIIGKFNF